MFIREDRKSVIFQEMSCFSRSKTIEMKNGVSMDQNRHQTVISLSLLSMLIREDCKSVIFTRNFALKFGYPKATRFRENLSHNFQLLSMLRDRWSSHGLKHAVDRDKSVTFPYVY